MAKYSTEFKMKVVKEYLESNISYKTLSDKYCIPSEIVVITWVNAYKSQGYEGLKVKRKNTQYTLEFKLNVVNLYLTGEMSYQSLANELKINNPSMIRRWVIDFREKGIEGLKSKKRGRPSEMSKSPKKSKNTKVESSSNITNSENESLTQTQLKEKIKKLEEQNYWLQLENDAIKKKIELSQMTDAEIRQLLKQLRS
ncbi:MAG: helix-turn-helix domain-containing protein [Finegoldia magna]|uniref:helix-turn-helix domain-containing protein n=1 Tax=Finegoldia magna TaxID=1260 RepID=UPI002909661E|nr:helix-turn-helix domain-containing protein [Finegoldia magna]MDU7141207.1 helix-turn-helix domain-containing protein [Finegoldia magna]